MRIVCSFCGRDMGAKPPLQDERVTHAICLDCVEYFEPQWNGMSFDEYLGRFAFPVILVDGEMRIVAVNEAAATLVPGESRSVTGMLAGNALECAYARLPGGCGRSEHCASCAIRNTITRTYETGEAMSRVPAALELAARSVRLSISSVRLGDFVRVRLEPDDGSPDRLPSVD